MDTSIHWLIEFVLGGVCAGDPARSLGCGIDPEPVCARCAGILLGLGAGLLAAWVAARRRQARLPTWTGWLAVGSIVLAVLGAVFEFESAWLRVLTGSIAGFSGGGILGELFRRRVLERPTSVGPVDHATAIVALTATLATPVVAKLLGVDLLSPLAAVALIVGGSAAGAVVLVVLAGLRGAVWVRSLAGAVLLASGLAVGAWLRG